MQLDLISQINRDFIVDALEDEAIQESLSRWHESGTPVTDQRFILFGFCLALSTYLSTVARGLYSSILKDQGKNRSPRGKKMDLVFVIIGDGILWFGVIAPLMCNIGHWFLTLPVTTPYFATMRGWLFCGILVAVVYMFLLHCIQSIRQLRLVFGFHSVNSSGP
jgi:hypothetical protein